MITYTILGANPILIIKAPILGFRLCLACVWYLSDAEFEAFVRVQRYYSSPKKKNRVLGRIILIIIKRNPHNSIGNYLGPYITRMPEISLFATQEADRS